MPAARTPAFALPAEKGRSGIRTAPTPFTTEGTSNELSFQDSAGSKEVRLVARRDLNVAITRNRSQVISGADSLSVAHNRQVVIDGTCATRIDGNAKTEYGSSAQVEVQGDLSERVLGKRTLAIEAHSSTTIGGLSETTVHAANRMTVDGLWVDHARSTYTLTVGDSDAPGRAETVVRGSASHAVDHRSTFSADELILSCGETLKEEDVFFVSRMMPLWGDDPKQNFNLPTLLWSLRNTP